eukprot:1858952-Ditylum_brightwellii.AAC.1
MYVLSGYTKVTTLPRYYSIFFYSQPLILWLKYGAPPVLVNLRSDCFQPRGPVSPEADYYVSSAQLVTHFPLRNRCTSMMVLSSSIPDQT